jgi:HSP20 family protein
MDFFTDLYQVSRSLVFRSSASEGLTWSPPMDVYETEEAYEVILEIAGVPRETIHIGFLHDMLTVGGKRSDKGRPESARYSQMEINYGPFQKEIRFPSPIERTAISAHYRDGLLKVVLPKAR